jgi:hypothetical protein
MMFMNQRRDLQILLICAVLGGLPPIACAAESTIRNGVFWKDTSGTPIYSQGGGILKVGDIYYW